MTNEKRENGSVCTIVPHPLVRFVEPDGIEVSMDAYENPISIQAPYNMNPEYIRRLVEHGSVVVLVAIENDVERKLPPMKVWLSDEEAQNEQLRRIRERDRLRDEGKKYAPDFLERRREELKAQMTPGSGSGR